MLAIERTGREVLGDHVAGLDEPGENRLASLVLRVQCDAALVVVQHREIQAVDIGDVPQLAARGIPLAGTLDLDDVGTEPGQQLGAGRAGLDVGHVQDAYSLQGFHGDLQSAPQAVWTTFSTIPSIRRWRGREPAMADPSRPTLWHLPVTALTDGAGFVVDWVVEMVRFDESAVLEHVAERGDLDLSLMAPLARLVARLHGSSRTDRGPVSGADSARWWHRGGRPRQPSSGAAPTLPCRTAPSASRPAHARSALDGRPARDSWRNRETARTVPGPTPTGPVAGRRPTRCAFPASCDQRLLLPWPPSDPGSPGCPTPGGASRRRGPC